MSRNNIICISCPKGCRISINSENKNIDKIEGYQCIKGKDYAHKEFLNPTRILPTTVLVKNGELPLVSVKTKDPIPKDYLLKAMSILAKVEVEAPVNCGDLIVENILDTGVNVVATNNIKAKEAI